MLSPITEINVHKFRPFRYKRRKQICKMSEYIGRIIKVCKILMIKSLTQAVNVDLKRLTVLHWAEPFLSSAINKFPPFSFMTMDCSLQYSLQPATGPYSESARSNPHPNTQFLKKYCVHFNNIPTSTIAFPSGLFPSDFPIETICISRRKSWKWLARKILGSNLVPETEWDVS